MRGLYMKIEDLKVGGKDVVGNHIYRIYATAPKHYAIYQSDYGVVVHFSDEPAEEATQRKRMSGISGIRGKINTLISGWRDSQRYKNKTSLYDARVATALALCLEDDQAGALKTLQEITEEVALDKSHWLTYEYFFAAGATVIASVFVLA